MATKVKSLNRPIVESSGEITISNRQRVKKVDSRLLKQIVSAIFEELKIGDAEIEINLVSAEEMAEINWKFLRHKGSTDVITFDHAENQKQIHGELFICVDDAIKQAKEFKTSWQSEIVRYIVHGVLHLLGYDDLKPHLRHKMKREENRLVRLLAKKFSLAQIAGHSKISA